MVKNYTVKFDFTTIEKNGGFKRQSGELDFHSDAPAEELKNSLEFTQMVSNYIAGEHGLVIFLLEITDIIEI